VLDKRQRLGFEASVLGVHVIDGRTDGSQTLCWRELDSNFQFRAKMATLCVVRDESDRPSAMSYEQFLKI
jgi:hypothetical protein